MSVFISHCTPDDAFVDALAQVLEQHGFKTWIDHRDMPAGSRWVSHLEKQLEESDAMLLVLSNAALESTYVKSEWHAYFDLKKPIFPLMLEDCKMPLFLRGFHSVNFRNPQHFERQVEALIDVLPNPSHETLGMRPYDSDANLQWNEVLTTLCDRSDRLITQYARPLEPYTLQLVLPLAEDIVTYPLGRVMVIGRQHSQKGFCPDIDLRSFAHSSKISREHAVIQATSQGLGIFDAHSTNGTYIEREHLEPEELYPLPSDTLIFLGNNFPMLVRYRLD